MPMTSKEMIKFLKRNGFVVLRQKGYIPCSNEKSGKRQTNHCSRSRFQTFRKRIGTSNLKAGRTKKIVLLHL